MFAEDSSQRPDGHSDLQAIEAAARVLFAEGRAHGWWKEFDKPYEELDPIGKLEFDGMVERVLLAAQNAGFGTSEE